MSLMPISGVFEQAMSLPHPLLEWLTVSSLHYDISCVPIAPETGLSSVPRHPIYFRCWLPAITKRTCRPFWKQLAHEVRSNCARSAGSRLGSRHLYPSATTRDLLSQRRSHSAPNRERFMVFPEAISSNTERESKIPERMYRR
jgi:hypothetical protein